MKVALFVCALDHVDDPWHWVSLIDWERGWSIDWVGAGVSLCEPCALQRGSCDVGKPAGPDLCQRLEEPVEPVFFGEGDFVDDDCPRVVTATGLDGAGSGEDLVDPPCRVSDAEHALVVSRDPDFRVSRLFCKRRRAEPVDDGPRCLDDLLRAVEPCRVDEDEVSPRDACDCEGCDKLGECCGLALLAVYFRG